LPIFAQRQNAGAMKDDSISLNKYISDTGMCSRREADKLIRAGRVSINRNPTRPGNRVSPGDEVRVDGRPLVDRPEPLYIAFHKPVGIVCTSDDREKENIIRYINHPQRLFHIGRLDKLSEGLIFLTNDGDIVNKILRADNKHEKEYIVTVDKAVNDKFLKNMANGVQILDRVTKPCTVEKISPKVFKIILTQGLNRQIRRMCTHLGYEVVKLKRVRIMHVTLDGLQSGDWRDFTSREITILREIIGDSTNDSAKTRSRKPTSKTRYKPKIDSKPKRSESKYSKGKRSDSKFSGSKKSFGSKPRQGKSAWRPNKKG